MKLYLMALCTGIDLSATIPVGSERGYKGEEKGLYVN